jgi:hypothetical protein
MGTGLKMLTAECCLRRAERLKIKMLTNYEPEKRARLITIANGYRRLRPFIRCMRRYRALGIGLRSGRHLIGFDDQDVDRPSGIQRGDPALLCCLPDKSLFNLGVPPACEAISIMVCPALSRPALMADFTS